MIGAGYQALIHREDLAAIRPVVRTMLEMPGATHRFDIRILHADGHWIVGPTTARCFEAGTLAAGVAHQINNPIAAIRAGSEFASDERPEKTRENLVKIVDRACELTVSYAQQRHFEIEVERPLTPIWINVISIEIEQVVVNLLRNAVESQPKTAKIVVVASAKGGSARDARRRMWDLFCQLKASVRSVLYNPH